MLRITLGQADRERLGAPEVLSYDSAGATLREHRLLWGQCGLDFPLLDERLNSSVENERMEARAALVWLALIRAGVDVAFADLDFTLAEAAIESVPDPNQAARKAGRQPAKKATRTRR